MGAYYNMRLNAFNSQWRINGTTIEYDGESDIPALCPSKEIFKEMARTDFLGRRTANFTIRRSDYERLNLESKKIIESGGVKFMIEAVLDDDAEPCVDLKSNLLQ